MSFVGQLFKYIAAKKLMNDQSIISAIIDAENNKERIRKEIETKYDKKTIQKAVHPDVRKYLGFKY